MNIFNVDQVYCPDSKGKKCQIGIWPGPGDISLISTNAVVTHLFIVAEILNFSKDDLVELRYENVFLFLGILSLNLKIIQI